MAIPTVSVGKSTKKTDIDAVVSNTRMEIGSIIMFDANRPPGGSGGGSGAWVDNETMPGWYACVAANAAHGCPDLVDRFVMGKAIAGAGATGGSNTHTITSGELPLHTHTGPSHTHDLSNHTHICPRTHLTGTSWGMRGDGTYHSAQETGAADPNNTGAAGTGATGNGGFANTPIDTKPAYYGVIFIRKCYDV